MLTKNDQAFTLQVPSEVFGDGAALRRFIAGRGGETFTVRAGMGKHLAPAILSQSTLKLICHRCHRITDQKKQNSLEFQKNIGVSNPDAI
jgi:hypothetical protein